MSKARPIAAGTVVFHPLRGFGVLTGVNLMTGWVSARFGNEHRALDLCLGTDSLQHADGEPILFRRSAPDYMPHGRLMEVVRALHAEGYERLYLYSWPKPSGMHWRWHLFAGQRDWVHRPLRPGWHGSGSSYIFDPVIGWGDRPGATTGELVEALKAFDPQGLHAARGQDPAHREWFAKACEGLLPDHAYSLGWEALVPGRSGMPDTVPTMALRRGVRPYAGPAIDWPPGWIDGWAHHGYHRTMRRAPRALGSPSL